MLEEVIGNGSEHPSVITYLNLEAYSNEIDAILDTYFLQTSSTIVGSMSLEQLRNNLDTRMKEHREKMLALGYTEADLQVLQRGIECIVYPFIRNHFKHLYEESNEDIDILPGKL